VKTQNSREGRFNRDVREKGRKTSREEINTKKRGYRKTVQATPLFILEESKVVAPGKLSCKGRAGPGKGDPLKKRFLVCSGRPREKAPETGGGTQRALLLGPFLSPSVKREERWILFRVS